MSGLIKPPFGTQLNPGQPLAQGLVGCWLFNEGSGNKAYDSSGQGNHGALINVADPPTPTSGWGAGPDGGALVLDGSDDYVEIPYASSLKFTADATVSIWFLPSALPAGTHNLISYGGNTYNYGWLINQDAANLLIYWRKNNGSSVAIINNVFAVGALVNIIVTVLNGHFVAYVNGVNKNETDLTLGTINNLKTWIGGIPTGWRVAGLLPSVQVFNRALSAEEVAYLYAFPYAMFEDAATPTRFFLPPLVAGTGAGVLPNLTAMATGAHGVAGTGAGTLGNLSGNAIGTFREPNRWKFPTLFADSGFSYGDYDPGQAAAIAIGCLHLYMKTGDDRAGRWARRILDDLRVNRWDQDYGGYRSDRHYGWLNALVLQAFGLAVNGAPGQAYRFPASPEDEAHFDVLLAWIMARAGDQKPNVLNSDLIPFTYSEAGEMWSYAPNYLAMEQMGSLEAVVLMLAGALELGKLRGDWDWFNRLLAFMVRDNLAVLAPEHLKSVTATCDQTGAANLVRLRFADYDQDSSKYCEARNQTAIDNWGEQARELDFRYGSPVILEDPALARLLAERLLQRLAPAWEAAEVETWLEGVRIELGDTVAVSSDFHGWDREEFTVLGKNLELGRRRVQLKLSRTLDRAAAWAVDAAGSAGDAWAIDQASSWDEDWDSRAYVY